MLKQAELRQKCKFMKCVISGNKSLFHTQEVWGYRWRWGGNINIVIMAGNDKKIRVMSRVKAPKWAAISPYYRDVKELRDEMDERMI